MSKTIKVGILIIGILFFLTSCNRGKILIIQTDKVYSIKKDAPVVLFDNDKIIGRVKGSKLDGGMFNIIIEIFKNYTDSIYSESRFYIVSDGEHFENQNTIIRVEVSHKGVLLRNGDRVRGRSNLEYVMKKAGNRMIKGWRKLRGFKIVNKYEDSIKLWIRELGKKEGVKKAIMFFDSLGVDSGIIEDLKKYLNN